MSEYLQQVFGYNSEIADFLASRLGGGGGGGGYGGGGGGGYGGGGGGGIDAMMAAARDAAAANVASTYATASATFDGSPDEYRKIHAEERATDSGATANASGGAEAAAKAAIASRALERKALGIEDAAAVVSDTVANEQKIATDNAARNDKRMETRAQGHLDNALKFNTDLKSVVELEGKEKQKQIADLYAGKLASIAAGRGGGGGGGGGGRRGGGGGGGRSSSSSKLYMTPGQMWGAARDLQGDDLRRLDAMYGPGYRQSMLTNFSKSNPKASLGQQISGTKFIMGKGPYGR